MPAVFEFDEVVVVPDGSPAVRALDGLTLAVPDQGLTVIVGPSGAGKSTLLRLCNRLELPTAGRVLFRGEDVATLDPLRLRRQVGMVFQRPVVFPGTVRDNLRVAAPHLDDVAGAAVLVRAGLDATFLDRVADDVSGGEAQRVCLARTLVTEPAVLLMDEPTSALDPANARHLEELGRTLADQGVPVVWVTHDLGRARRIADQLVVVIAGRVASAPAREAFLAGEDAAPTLPTSDGGAIRPLPEELP